jgi:hypothetical protein
VTKTVEIMEDESNINSDGDNASEQQSIISGMKSGQGFSMGNLRGIPDNHDLKQVVRYFKGAKIEKKTVIVHLEALIAFVNPNAMFERRN